MRHDAPNTFAGRLVVNFDLTTPELPCGRDTRLRRRTASTLVSQKHAELEFWEG